MDEPAPSSDADDLRAISAEIAASCAGFNLRRATRAVTQHFDHALAPVGLRATQFTLLAALAVAGPVSVNRLAHGLVMDRTTLTRNLRLLRDAGLVDADAGRAGREQLLMLSDGGRATLARAIPRWRRAQTGIVDSFGPGAWPSMVADLRRLVEGTLGLETLGHKAEPEDAPLAVGRA